MDLDPLLSSWIVEALGTAGRAAPPLTVAKGVWARHEHDLRSAGDLLFTWQLDLRTCADAMIAAGTLTSDDAGNWTLPPGTTIAAPVRRRWTEPEIAAAVSGYVALLRGEESGELLRRSEVISGIEEATGRTGEQLDTMMSNISAVVQEHGIMPLASWRPRSNVPAGVRPAVAAALDC